MGISWEVEIKVRRNGRLHRRESALGADPLTAFENASNDLVRDLQTETAALDPDVAALEPTRSTR